VPAAGAVVLVAAALLPVGALPDLAWGGLGRLAPANYPADWDRVAAYVGARARDGDELVTLPLSTFRAYSFNGGRTSLDPTPRYLPARVIVDDRLVVGDLVLAGENTRAAQMVQTVAAGRSLADTGARWVLVQHGTPGEVRPSALAGLRQVYSGRALTLYENPQAAAAPSAPLHRWVLLLAAYALALVVLVVNVVVTVRKEILLFRATAW
jgi:hypothetical protein